MIKPKVIWEPYPGAQVKFLTCPAWECLLHGNRGGGKGLLPSEKVLTPRGWTTVGELKKGSVISNPDGSSQSVIAVYHRDKQQMYELTFSDGTKIECDEDHLWFAKIANRTKGKTVRNYMPLDFYGSIHRTGDLYALLKKYPHKHPLIPCNDPIKYQQNWKTVINPYVLGLILGDGSIKDLETRITVSDKEIKETLELLGAVSYRDKRRNYLFSCKFSRQSHIAKQVDVLGLRGKDSSTKFIPERILRGTVKERKVCLQGLMDSDGTVDKDGRCSFTTISSSLAKDTRQLILSLGGWATISKKTPTYTYDGKVKTGKLAYTLYIQFPKKSELFTLKRKKERCTFADYAHGRLVRTITSIVKLKDKKQTICIVVNNPNRLFVTKDFLVTHNTDVLIMDYLQGVGRGYGPDYKGLLLREATTELGDVISKCKKWIPKIFPTAKYNNSKKIWTFEDGETLWLNYARVLDDYEQYHGHEYPWIGWEELTNHPLPAVYLKLMSCNRSSNPNIQKKYRATCNPSGPGHQWVKERFIDTVKAGKIHREIMKVEFPDEHGDLVKKEFTVTRTHIKSYFSENKSILKADPLYMAKIHTLTEDNPMLRKAWIEGSWDLLIGGFFTDVWDPKIHIIPWFPIPRSWRLYRSFDWGSSKPWAVTYGFESNGEQPDVDGIPYIPKNSIIIPDELYGWNGTANQGDPSQALSSIIADRVHRKDKQLLLEYGVRVHAGPADTQIWEVRDGKSIATELSTHGCRWTKAHKGPGSRVSGWSVIRQMLGAAKRKDLENPHLYFFDSAAHHIRTLPLMQRDSTNIEDIDTDLEDHAMDSLRYLLTRKLTRIQQRKVGM